MCASEFLQVLLISARRAEPASRRGNSISRHIGIVALINNHARRGGRHVNVANTITTFDAAINRVTSAVMLINSVRRLVLMLKVWIRDFRFSLGHD